MVVVYLAFCRRVLGIFLVGMMAFLQIFTVFVMVWGLGVGCRGLELSESIEKETTSELRGLYDDEYLLRLARQEGSALYGFEMCSVQQVLKKGYVRENPGSCVPAFRSAQNHEVFFTLHALRSHELDQESIEKLKDLQSAWSDYQQALLARRYSWAQAAGIVAGGSALVIGREGVFMRFSEQKVLSDLQVSSRGSVQARQWLERGNLPKVIPKPLYLSTTDPAVLSPKFIAFVQSRGGSFQHLKSPWRWRIRNTILDELTKQYLKRGNSIKDLIVPEFWQRYLEYCASELGEVAEEAPMIKHFRKDPYGVFRYVFEFAQNQGISPKLTQSILKAYPALATSEDIRYVMQRLKQRAFRKAYPRMVRGSVLVSLVSVGSVVYVLQRASHGVKAASEDLEKSSNLASEYVDSELVQKYPHLPVLLENWQVVVSPHSKGHSEVSSLKEYLKSLGVYLRLWPEEEGVGESKTFPPIDSYCYPTASLSYKCESLP